MSVGHPVRVPRNVSVLVVVAAPDSRGSSFRLQRWTERLGERHDVTCDVWFLRDLHGWAWPGARVVDSLRRWVPAVALEVVGASKLAAGLRGRALRRWLVKLNPDVVIFNDGYGERVLDGYRGEVIRVGRFNDEAAVGVELEAIGPQHFDVVLAERRRVRVGDDGPHGAAASGPAPGRIVERSYDSASIIDRTDRAERLAARHRLGLALDVPLVVGWGEDSWVDGPDIFIRALWALSARHGVLAHGLWLSPETLDHEERRLRAEAVRCGVGERYHRHTDLDFINKVCGDAVLLPYRAANDPIDVLDVVTAGLEVVTFGIGVLDDPDVVSVPYLDVEALADALAKALSRDRDQARAEAHRRLGVDAMLDELVALARGGRAGLGDQTPRVNG